MSLNAYFRGSVACHSQRRLSILRFRIFSAGRRGLYFDEKLFIVMLSSETSVLVVCTRFSPPKKGLRRVRVLYDFQARNSKELSVQKGEEVAVRKK